MRVHLLTMTLLVYHIILIMSKYTMKFFDLCDIVNVKHSNQNYLPY